MAWLNLSDQQKATVAAALTTLSGLFLAGVVVWAGVSFVRLIDYFSGVLAPLAVAFVITLVTRPYFQWLITRVRAPVLALALYFASLLVPLGLFGWFFGSLLVGQVADFLSHIPGWLASLSAALQERMPALREFLERHDLADRLRKAVLGNLGLLTTAAHALGVHLASAGAGLFRTAAGMLGWLIMPVYVAFFLLMKPFDPSGAGKYLPFLKPATREDAVYLLRELTDIIVSFFRGQILSAFVAGAMYAVAFALVGVPYGLAIGLLMGLLNIVPYLGTAVGLVLSVLLSWAKPDGGGMTGVALALAAFGVVQAIESYVTTPRIMGRRTGLHPMVIMVAMFFWGTALGGLLGILLAVPLTAFLVVLWRLLKAKYIRAIV